VAPGPARRVQHRPRRKVVEERSNHRLLERNRVVARIVIGLRPTGIARRHVVFGEIAPFRVRGRVESLDDLLDLADALLHAAEAPLAARSEQGETFDSQ